MKSNIQYKTVWRVYDKADNGRFIKEFAKKATAERYAARHSIYYEVRCVNKAYLIYEVEFID